MYLNCGTPGARNFLLCSRTSVECCIAWRSTGRNFILKFSCSLRLLLKLAAWNSNVSSISPRSFPPSPHSSLSPRYGPVFKSVPSPLCYASRMLQRFLIFRVSCDFAAVELLIAVWNSWAKDSGRRWPILRNLYERRIIVAWCSCCRNFDKRRLLRSSERLL